MRTIPGVGSGSQLSLVSHQVFPPILLEGFAAWVDSAEEHSWGWLRLHSRSTRSEPASPDPFSHTPNQPLISALPVHRNNTKWQFRECCSNWCLSWWSSKAQPTLLPVWHQHWAEPGLSGIHSDYLIFEEIKWSLTWKGAKFPPLIWLVYPPPGWESLKDRHLGSGFEIHSTSCDYFFFYFLPTSQYVKPYCWGNKCVKNQSGTFASYKKT